MSNIVLSAGVRQNLLSLQNTAQLMAETQNRLATGKKVNSALDNPVNFFTSSSLHARANDLGSLLDSMSNGIKTLEAADNALTSITSTVQSMQSTLRQARQDRSFKTDSYVVNVAAPPTGTEQISFSGGSIGATPIDVALTTGGPTSATYTAGTFTAMDFSAASATAGQATLTFGAGGTLDTAATLDFTVTVDGVAQNISISQADVLAIGDADSTIDDAAEFRTLLTANVTGVTVGGSGNSITLTSSTTGVSSDVNIGIATIGGTVGTSTLTATAAGLNASINGTAGTAAGAAKTLTFDVAADGGAATAVTINLAAVQAIGDNDGIIDSVAELALIVDAQVGAGVTVNGAGTTLTLTSATTGTTSSLAISNLAATNVTNTTGISNTPAPLTGTVTTTKTIDQLVASINNTVGLKDKIRASSDSGKLRIENFSTSELTVTGINGLGELNGGAGTSDIAGNDVRKTLVQQFNTLRDQLDKFADDAYFNGVNLMRGDKLKLVFNETGVSSIEIQALDKDGNPVSVSSAYLNIQSVTPPDFDSDVNIDGMLDTMSTALQYLRAQASNFGSNLSVVQNRQDFTKKMINTLETGGDTLVLADTNEEGANLLALQTRQQLSTTALSLSAQADQAVLRLFG